MIGGRLFGENTFEYSATDAIDNPIMALEYIKRNQDWSDNAGTALIKTSGDGSFRDSSLDELKALTIARQIQDEGQQWTESLSKSLCEAFYLISRQDEDGYECVEYIFREDAPSDTITIADIISGSLGMIINPRAENIYVEPFVLYGYDYASSRYTQSLRIEGIANNSTWNSDLTPGFSGTDGELLWNTCKTNYIKYGRIEKIPNSISEQQWIVDYDTALWKITKMIEYQTKKRFSFSLYYSQARKWFVGKQINIQFANETDDESLRVVITKISKNKNANRINLSLLL